MIYYIPGTQPDHSEKPILRTVTETLSDIPKKATWIFSGKELEDACRGQHGAYRLRARAQKHDEVNRDSTRSARERNST